MSNSKIKSLLSELETHTAACRRDAEKIRGELQAEYNKVFDDSKALATAIGNAENASEYQTNRDGEIELWFRYRGLSDISLEAREYFERWLDDNHCYRVDWDNECFLIGCGDDNYLIQDDSRHRRDNGVWQGQNLIIPETEYLVEDDGHSLTHYTVDVEKRNALIEAHMEKTGYFPGVFRVTQYGDVFPVSTQNKKDGAA